MQSSERIKSSNSFQVCTRFLYIQTLNTLCFSYVYASMQWALWHRGPLWGQLWTIIVHLNQSNVLSSYVTFLLSLDWKKRSCSWLICHFSSRVNKHRQSACRHTSHIDTSRRNTSKSGSDHRQLTPAWLLSDKHYGWNCERCK